MRRGRSSTIRARRSALPSDKIVRWTSQTDRQSTHLHIRGSWGCTCRRRHAWHMTQWGTRVPPSRAHQVQTARASPPPRPVFKRQDAGRRPRLDARASLHPHALSSDPDNYRTGGAASSAVGGAWARGSSAGRVHSQALHEVKGGVLPGLLALRLFSCHGAAALLLLTCANASAMALPGLKSNGRAEQRKGQQGQPGQSCGCSVCNGAP